MKLAAMQPYFFPYIGYFQLIAAVDRFVCYDKVDYSKQGWVDRNRLLSVNGQPYYIRVPLEERRPPVRIADLTINACEPWQKRLLKSFSFDYRKAPFFDETYDLIRTALEERSTSLAELNFRLLRTVAEHMAVRTQVVRSDEHYDAVEHEIRYGTHDPSIDQKTARIIEICRHEAAAVFINPLGGAELYSKDVFARHGVELLFLKPRLRRYRSAGESDDAQLSVIDVLMQCGRETTSEMVREFDLV